MNKHRVLMVDDEPGLTMLFKTLLERTGRIVVQTENSGRNALESARRFRPDLVLLDCCLPDGNGRDIAAALNGDPALHDVPVVLMTGLAIPGETHFEGLPVLSKPIRGDRLVQYALAILDAEPAAAA